MDDYDYDATVMWREGTHRCELWKTDVGTELRVYVRSPHQRWFLRDPYGT